MQHRRLTLCLDLLNSFSDVQIALFNSPRLWQNI